MLSPHFGLELGPIRMDVYEEAQKFKSSLKPGLHVKAHSRRSRQVICKQAALRALRLQLAAMLS